MPDSRKTDREGRELAEFLELHGGTLDDGFGDEIMATRELLTLDDPWND